MNGRAVTNGGDRANLIDTMRSADRGATGPSMQFADGHIVIGPGRTTRPATVWLVRYDSRTLNVPIRAGENGGRTLAHRNVVRSIDRLGSWTGASASFAVPSSRGPADRTAVLVQAGKGGPIIGAARS